MVHTKAGTRAFSVAASTVWNSLPASVELEGNIVPVRRRLKIDLFYAAVLLTFLAPSSIRRRLANCFTIARLFNPLVLSRH